MGLDPDGELLLDEKAVQLYENSDRYIREISAAQVIEVKRRYQRYRGVDDPPDVGGKTVLVVDDGVATGFTMLAALQSLRRRGAEKRICVVPVASPRVLPRLEESLYCF